MSNTLRLHGGADLCPHLCARLILFGCALTSPWTLGGVAHAQDDEASANIRVVNTTVVEYRADNRNGRDDDDNYGVGINRLNLLGSADNISTALRFDGFYFLSEDKTDRNFRDDARLERVTVNYRLGDWTLTGGDVYRQLGRGILMSVRKVAEVGQDTSSRGGQIEYDSYPHKVYAFVGRANSINLDPVSQKFVTPVEDILAGTQYEYSLDPLSVGVMAMYLQPEQRLLETERDWTRGAGVFINAYDVLDWATFYVEADMQERALGGTGERGYAGYATSTIILGDTSILLEGMILDQFEVRGSENTAVNNRFFYNQPPTLERIDQEVLNTRDVQGGRVRVEQYIDALEMNVYVNSMIRFADPGEDNELSQIHNFAGFNLDYGDGARLLASAGRRVETTLETDVWATYATPDGDPSIVKSINHVEGDWLQPLGGGYALHLSSLNEFRTIFDAERGEEGGGRPWRRGSTFLGLEVSGLGSLTFEYGFDTLDPDAANRFFAGILAWQQYDVFNVRTTVGTQRGGLKCVAGVCREFPGFAGAQVEMVGRF